jgi:hypothetical protein
MRAVVYRGPCEIRVEDRDIPPSAHPDDTFS